MSVPLQPVSLNKGRPAPVPRISPRRDPNAARRPRNWAAEEDEVLRQYYPEKGMPTCALKLPNRTLAAINGRITKLGLKYLGTPRPKRPSRSESYVLTAEMEAAIREAFPNLAGRGATTELARKLDVSRRWLRDQLLNLGLVVPLK